MAKSVLELAGKGIERIDISTYVSLDEVYDYLTQAGMNLEC